MGFLSQSVHRVVSTTVQVGLMESLRQLLLDVSLLDGAGLFGGSTRIQNG